MGRVTEEPQTRVTEKQPPASAWSRRHNEKGTTPAVMETGVDENEEEEVPDEYAGLPVWKRALMKKKAMEQRMKEEEEKQKVRRDNYKDSTDCFIHHAFTIA